MRRSYSTLCGPVRAYFRQISAQKSGCGHPKPLLGCATCDVPAPSGAPAIRIFLLVMNPRRRQAQAFLVAIAAALVAAAGATADPSVTAKQAQAQQVLSQINTIDTQLGAAVEAYNTANVRLEKIKSDLHDNAFALKTARANLKLSQ